MTTQEALNILKPEGNTLDDLKKAKRAIAKKYHPDINPQGLELMKLVNAAYDQLVKEIGLWDYKLVDLQSESIDEEILSIFQKIQCLEGLEAEVCGTWLWIGGETYTHKDVLKNVGLKFAGQKKKWYWHPGTYQKKSRKSLEMDEIRDRFGSVKMSFREAQRIG